LEETLGWVVGWGKREVSLVLEFSSKGLSVGRHESFVKGNVVRRFEFFENPSFFSSWSLSCSLSVFLIPLGRRKRRLRECNNGYLCLHELFGSEN
jgi:hypothetical protein